MDTAIELMKRDGARKLHVLSDFDRTLTKTKVNGKDAPSLISVLRDNGYLTPDYSKKAHALFEQYHPIEINRNVPRDEKKKAMKEWWTRHFALLIASGLTRDDIQKAMTSRHAELREGAHEFFSLLEDNDIPLVIMSSSGLGIDSIQLFLEAEHENRRNISVISNRYVWDKSGKAVAVQEPIIHGMNKDETLVRNFPAIFDRVKTRTNVLLLGDNESDLDMVNGFDYTQLLSVGFVERNERPHSTFNLMLDPASSLSPVTKLVSDIIS